MKMKLRKRNLRTAAAVVAGIAGLGMASNAMAIETPLFVGANLLADGPAKGLDENLISADATVGNHYISPNAHIIGATGRSSSSLSATHSGTGLNAINGTTSTPIANQQIGEVESLRVDSTVRGGGVSEGIDILGGKVKWSDGIQGVNLPQPHILPSAGAAADNRAGVPNIQGAVVLDPDAGNAPRTDVYGDRIGAVGFYSINNPAGPNAENIDLGKSTAQLYGMTVLRAIATPGGASLEDDGLAPGSVNETTLGIGAPAPDFVPFSAVDGGGGVPVTARTASFVLEFMDESDLQGAGLIAPDGTEIVAGARNLIPRYQLFDDATTLIVPESPPLREENFNHNGGNSGQGQSTGVNPSVPGGPDIDDVTDGLLLLGGEIFDAQVTLTWRETAPGSGDFLWDADFSASVRYTEGDLFDKNRLASPTGSVSANWANIPFNFNSDGVFGPASPNGVVVDGVMVDVSSTAPNLVDAGGWDFLLSDDPNTSDYDIDSYSAVDPGTLALIDPRFTTDGSGSNDVSFTLNSGVPEPVTSTMGLLALAGLAGYTKRRR